MVAIIIIICAIVIDQFTKIKALSLRDGDVSLVGEKLKLVYVENRGAAFGFLQNKKIFLSLITIVILFLLVYVLMKNYLNFSLITKISLSLIIGGAIGNFIDRLFRGYVVDFISYTFFNGYNFPVFNFADIFVVTGCILMIISVFFTKDLEEI